MPVTVAGIVKRFGALDVLNDVSLDVPAGATVALLGPSGCGKTTLLRIIAGLERPDLGHVVIGDRTVASDADWVPAERRRVGMVFQDWALFPHLTVARNVGYGLPRPERDGGQRVTTALSMVGLDGIGDRLPGTLSGGQQQRVALARSLAAEPQVLLLDEPFSNLDTSLRVQVRADVHRLLAELEMTTVFVTHDQDEAFVLGDEVAVMQHGRVVQQAAPADVYARPATPWVASFVGEANLLDGRVAGGEAATAIGSVPVHGTVQGTVQVLVRPEHLQLGRGGTGRVELFEYYGHDTVYLVELEDGPVVRVRAGAGPAFALGDAVTVRYVGPPAVAYDGAADRT